MPFKIDKIIKRIKVFPPVANFFMPEHGRKVVPRNGNTGEIASIIM